MKDLLLGIDIGTSGTKCSLYRLDGSMEASAYQEYPMLHPQPGWAEQEPERWWKAVCENLQDCFVRQGVDSGRIAAVGVSGTNAVVLVDAEGRALGHALGLHDQRSSAQLRALQESIGAELVLEHAGNRLAKGSFALPRLKWLQDNCPELIARSRCFLTPCGYITRQLTGEFVISHSRANLTLLANIHTGDWDERLVEGSGFPAELLPRSIPGCSVAGTVTGEAARATGLKEGTPVAAGAVDTVQATLAAGAVEPGDIAITIGSSGRVCTISRGPILDSRLLNCESPVPGVYTIIQTTDNAGVSLRWFRDVFGGAVRDEAQSRGLSTYALLDEKAAAAPPGAGGMLYLPYLSGEQSPIWDSAARGVFFRMSQESSYGCFVRAVLEGVAFSIRDCLELVLQDGERPDCIPIGGGVANSEVWCQIFADVLGVPVTKLVQPETETLGDAITAAISIGLPQPDLYLGRRMIAKSRIFHPRDELRGLYDESFRQYKSLYQHLKCEF